MPAITLSGSAEQLMPENKLRKSFVIQNEDASINVFIKAEEPDGLTVSTTDHDHRIGPGGSLDLADGRDGLAQIQSRYTIVPASGTPLVSVFETESIQR